MPPESDPLSDLLRRCDSVPAAPADLERRVRRHLADRPVHPPSLWQRVDAAFARPSFAAAFVAGCILLGLFTAEARIARVQAQRTIQLERSYLELIDPLIQAPHP